MTYVGEVHTTFTETLTGLVNKHGAVAVVMGPCALTILSSSTMAGTTSFVRSIETRDLPSYVERDIRVENIKNLYVGEVDGVPCYLNPAFDGEVHLYRAEKVVAELLINEESVSFLL